MLFPNLSTRIRLDEAMDDPSLDEAEHERALLALRRINAWSATAGNMWRPIVNVARDDHGSPLRVLDVAAGGGDVIIGIAKRVAKQDLNVECHGCDISQRALDFARRHAVNCGVSDQTHFFKQDALGADLPRDYDIVMSTLFLHHLERDDAIELLGNMRKAAKRAVIVCDLDRCVMGYLLCRWLTRFITRSKVVHNDAVLSLRAAFTLNEVQTMAKDAGMEGAIVHRVWPWRWMLQWNKP